MADQKFAIQKQIFEIEAFSKEQVHELQNRISRLVNYSLVKKMENYFAEVIPADLLLRMDQLVLDIGVVNWISMEDDIEQRVMEALDYEFTQRLEMLKNDKTRSLAGISIETTEKGKLELFEYFLLHGVLPWYADTAVKFDMDELLSQLYNANRPALGSVILRAGKDPNVRFRMSHHFRDRSIKQMISVIEPAEAAFIFQTHKELTRLQHNKHIVQETENDFSKTIWLFILDFLLVKMGSKFEKKMFVKSNLTQIAVHYNINYLYLLQSFYNVMNTLKRAETFQPIQAVIYELFTELSDTGLKNNLLVQTGSAAEPDMLSLSSGFELLQYYLYTGSVPQAFAKMSRNDMKQLLLNMVKLAPATMRQLLLSLHKQPKGIFNLYQVMDTSESEAFTKLICSGNADEVESMVIFFSTLQQTEPFSHAAGSVFEHETWKYLLDYFLINEPSQFDETAAMRYLLKRFALGSNRTEIALVNVLSDILKKTSTHGTAIARPGILLKELLITMSKTGKEEEVVYVPGYYKDEQGTGEDIFSVTNTRSGLSSTVSYILQYGAVPWWGHEYHRFALSELITQLYESDATAMLLLFRKAMVKPAMKARLISDIPAGIFLDLIRQQPGSAEVIVQIDELLVLLERSKLLPYHETGFIQKTIFTIAWEIYGSTGYALFPAILFYHETIKRFSALLNIESGIFISALIQATETLLPVSAVNAKSLLLALQDHVDEQKPQQPEELPEHNAISDMALEEMQETVPDPDAIWLLINESKTIQQHVEFTGKPASVVVAGLRAVLQYFLQWNRLPDNLTILEKEQQKKLLREILTLLFSDNPVALRSLMENKANSIPAGTYLNELFSVEEGGEEKRMAQFLVEINFPVPDLLTEQNVPENYYPYEDIPGFDLAKIFSKESGIAGAAMGDKVLEESKRVLAYFLKYNRLPDDIAITGKGSIERFLREILLFLFTHHKTFITDQLQDLNTSEAAKLYLYDILAISYDIRSSQVKDFVQHISETGLNDLLKKKWKGKKDISEEDLPASILHLLQARDTETIKDADLLLLSSASFAKMILDRYGTDSLMQLASLKINRTFTSGPVIPGWLDFLQKAIPRGLYKEQVLELFNRFNILFISGRLNIYSNDSYTIAFINYLSGQLGIHAGEIFRQLFDHTLKPVKKTVPVIFEQSHIMQRMLRPLIVKHEELKKADAAIKVGEEKKLSVLVKQEIEQYRKQLAESLKKEIPQKTDTKPVDETDTHNKFKPETGESIYIANAGLVLFHPFLETFFSRTGLMENYKFMDDHCRNRAVLLLQYLATGNTDHAEHELVLNKILCNVPLEEAIPVSFIATETEIDVTRELLEVVIERWDKMKNTSAEGLQSSFIMRDGILNFREDYWNLKVEQKGYDVLLQTLPWAFGYIKMSWMQHNLIVEWI